MSDSVLIESFIGIDRLARAVIEQTDVADFIKRLDKAVSDWDVTKAVASYFESQMQIYARECEEDELPTVASPQPPTGRYLAAAARPLALPVGDSTKFAVRVDATLHPGVNLDFWIHPDEAEAFAASLIRAAKSARDRAAEDVGTQILEPAAHVNLGDVGR